MTNKSLKTIVYKRTRKSMIRAQVLRGVLTLVLGTRRGILGT